MYRCRFMAPSITTRSLRSPWLRRTRARPSLWYTDNRDSPLRIQCLHCLRSHTSANRRIICIRRRGAEMKQLTGFPWRGDFHRTSTLPLMWSASLSVASQDFAYASLRHPQQRGYFSLRIAICRQPDNSLQHLLWQILWHDPL